MKEISRKCPFCFGIKGLCYGDHSGKEEGYMPGTARSAVGMICT